MSHPLEALLQLQLGSDSYAVLHLPYILGSLTSDALLPSPHSLKWTARINSLLHAKSPDARWAGLCLAQKSSVHSKIMMIECAQTWIGIALPILSKKESSPVLSAAVRLLRVIFTAATDMPEFQRQVATPNVGKFTTALIPLAEMHHDIEFKTLILSTLALIIPLYPTLHKSTHSALSVLSLRFLNGNSFKPPNKPLMYAASRLYSVLHFTGGKVGGANLWRKSVDETLSFGWTSFLSLRTTFLVEGRLPQPPAGVASRDPLISVPLNLDRLRCSVIVLRDLLRTTTHRPIQVPLGPLIKFVIVLLSCTKDEKLDQHVDMGVRAMEAAVTPQIWEMACELLTCLATCVQHYLTSSLTQIVTCITIHLEQDLTSSERLPFLNTLHDVLAKCHPMHSSQVVNRLARAALPLVSSVLPKQVDARDAETDAASRSNKKGKKRARDFDGDEVFKLSREVVCSTTEDGNVLLAAFTVLRHVLRNSNLSPAMQSISFRVVLSVLLVLPQMPPASLSSDPKLYPSLLKKVQELSIELGAASTGGMSKSFGLIAGACLTDAQFNRDLEVLLHPRLPPLLRSMPAVEALSLYRAEESREERDAREILDLALSDETPPNGLMVSEPPAAAATAPAHQASLNEPIPPKSRPLLSQNPNPPMQPVSQTIDTAKPLEQKLPAPVPLPTLPVPARLPSPPPTKPVEHASTSNDVPMLVEEDEKNEEMPAIDLDSDSDSE